MEETVQESKDQRSSPRQIVKGKRTKRQRPQSPIPFTVNTSNVNDYSSSSPAVSSTGEFVDSTEEDEDMANCLILLAAQCHQQQSSTPLKRQPHATTNLQINNNKFNSRRFLQAPASSPGSGKSGYYVYECKTCNRTFPSFQALGGHRASHKKPRAAANLMMNDTQKLLFKTSPQQPQQIQHPLNNNSDEEDGSFRNVSSLSLQLSNNNNNNYRGNNGNLYSNVNVRSNNNNKIHECSICGAEFTSGQALGGHMRRHRAAPVTTTTTPTAMMTSTTNTTNTTLSLTPMAHVVAEAGENQDSRTWSPSRNNNNNNLSSLNLDLNLPAPEDDPRESKLQQQQQTSLVFSARPALVDCHY